MTHDHTDGIGDELDRRVDAATPGTAPVFGAVLERRRRRRHRRAVTAGALATAAVVAGASVVVGTAGSSPAPAPAVPPTTGPTPVPPPTTPPVVMVPDVDGNPPDLVLAGADGQVRTQGGSYCWSSPVDDHGISGMGCADMVVPDEDGLPDVGTAATLRAAFPFPGQWYVDASRRAGGGGCATYPVLVEPTPDGELLLTPSGPSGPRVGSYFVYAEGGDTSGFWRWTVPERDGLPLAWLTLTQNTESSGGQAGVRLVLDDAAVDGDVSASVTLTSAGGRSTSVALTRVDQLCDGDGTVTLSTPYDEPQRPLDRLGETPYTYEVVLEVDGVTHIGSGTWPGDGTVAGGDARIGFDPPLAPMSVSEGQ